MTLLLIGVMLGSATTAVVSVLLVSADPQRAQQFLVCGLGSFTVTTWSDLKLLGWHPDSSASCPTGSGNARSPPAPSLRTHRCWCWTSRCRSSMFRPELVDVLRRLAREQNVAVIMSTHELELALRVSDRMWLLDADRTLTCDTPTALAESGRIGAAFDRGRMRFDPRTLVFDLDSKESRA